MTPQMSQDIERRITWLHEEIDRCLSIDLPVDHLERELALINALNNSRERREALKKDPPRVIVK